MAKATFMLLLVLAFDAYAWMDAWAPAFKAAPADVRALSARSVSNFVHAASSGNMDACVDYCKGAALDLNGDRIDDYVFIIPWMGCGLNASGYEVYFIVSDGANGRVENVMSGYGVGLSDFVKVSGRTYFRHSHFFDEFEKSKHNHWVYQMFSFDTNGVMKCANAELGKPFPAATVFYSNPKFRQVELMPADRRKIADETKPVSHKYIP